MLVILHRAHSGVREVGAITAKGTSEHEMARVSSRTFISTLKAAGHRCTTIDGPIAQVWKSINDLMMQEQHNCVAISLHFNASSKGSASGHTAVINSHCEASKALANTIMATLSKELTWSKILPLVLAPTDRYPKDKWPNNLIWPNKVLTPHCLVEGGFNLDPKFAAWVDSPQGQLLYGELCAKGVIEWINSKV